MAQIITAIQMVYEEKFISKYNIAPLQAVGWEGMYRYIGSMCRMGRYVQVYRVHV